MIFPLILVAHIYTKMITTTILLDFFRLLFHVISMPSHERISTSVFHAVSDKDHSRFNFIPAQMRAII